MLSIVITVCNVAVSGAEIDVKVARELLTAATETFKMAKRIRKLEGELSRLKGKIKVCVSIPLVTEALRRINELLETFESSRV